MVEFRESEKVADEGRITVNRSTTVKMVGVQDG